MSFPTTFNPNVYNDLYIMFLQRFTALKPSLYTYQDYKNRIIFLTSWFNNITISELFKESECNRLSIFQEFEFIISEIFSVSLEKINISRKKAYSELHSNSSN